MPWPDQASDSKAPARASVVVRIQIWERLSVATLLLWVFLPSSPSHQLPPWSSWSPEYITGPCIIPVVSYAKCTWSPGESLSFIDSSPVVITNTTPYFDSCQLVCCCRGMRTLWAWQSKSGFDLPSDWTASTCTVPVVAGRPSCPLPVQLLQKTEDYTVARATRRETQKCAKISIQDSMKIEDSEILLLESPCQSVRCSVRHKIPTASYWTRWPAWCQGLHRVWD